MSADVRAGRLLSLKKIVTEEDLSNQVDGANLAFTLASTFVTGTVKVYLNGLRQQKGAGKDYNETGSNEITFSIAPEIGDILLVDYIKI